MLRCECRHVRRAARRVGPLSIDCYLKRSPPRSTRGLPHGSFGRCTPRTRSSRGSISRQVRSSASRPGPAPWRGDGWPDHPPRASPGRRAHGCECGWRPGRDGTSPLPGCDAACGGGDGAPSSESASTAAGGGEASSAGGGSGAAIGSEGGTPASGAGASGCGTSVGTSLIGEALEASN
jgi:hypothetical protein